MGIISINGQQVYVVDSKPVAAAKASNGVGYAQLVSQQRWKLYEQAENDVLRQMEFEKMGYQAQLDAYAKQKAELARSLTKVRDIKTKLANGDISNSEAIRLGAQIVSYEGRFAERGAVKLGKRQAIGKYTNMPLFNEDGTPVWIESESEKVYYDEKGKKAGKPIDPVSAYKKAAGALGVETPEDRKIASVAALEAEWKKGFAARTDKSLNEAAWAKSEEGKGIEAQLAAEKAKPLSGFIDTKKEEDGVSTLDKRMAEIQSEIDMLAMPEIGFDTNVGARTREAYAGMVGMGGLGLAPRKSKTSAVYDESRAREAMARQAAGFEDAIGATAAANEADLRNNILSKKAAQNAASRTNLMAVRLFAGTPEQKALIDQQIALIDQKAAAEVGSLTPEEQANISRTARQAAEQSFRATALEAGPGERTLQSFMDRAPAETGRRPDDSPRTKINESDLFKNFVLPGVDAAGFTFGGQGPVEPPPSPAVVSQRFESAKGSALGTPGTTSRPPNLEGIVEGVKPRVILTPPAPVPPAPVRDPLPEGKGFAAEIPGIDINLPPRPPTAPRPTQTEPSGAFELDDDNKDIKVGDLSPDVRRAAESPEARKKKKEDASKQVFVVYGIDTDANAAEQLKVYEEYIIQGKDKDPAFKINSEDDLVDPAAAEWYKTTLDDIRNNKTGKAKKKTRLESYSSNLMNIMQKGQKLADQPTKLQRLAKLDLSEKDRAKVVPEHILLVDKLYNINSAKGNGFQTTFAEIERVYKNDDKKKKAAQEYLAAKEILTA